MSGAGRKGGVERIAERTAVSRQRQIYDEEDKGER